MSQIIRQNTKLTAEQADLVSPLYTEYKALYGKPRTPAYRIADEHFAEFVNAGHGSTFEGFLAAKREVIGHVRGLIEESRK